MHDPQPTTEIILQTDNAKQGRKNTQISKIRSRTENKSNLDGLIEEVAEAHARIQLSMRSSLKDAIIAGDALNAIDAYCLPRQFGRCVEENFCIPLGLSMRTAQRYMQLATSYRVLIEVLREESLQRGEVIIDDEQLLIGLPINRALSMIREAVDAQESDETADEPETDSSNEQKLLQPGKPEQQGLVGPNNWYAPAKLVQQVIQVLGTIDLDPCAVSDSDSLPAAKRICSPVDGLSADVAWKGRLFINPGFKGVQPGVWISKAQSGFVSGDVVEAIVLVQATTNSEWARDTNHFPRAFFRSKLTVQAAGETTPRIIAVPAMLIFIARQERFAAFAEAFCDTHDVYLSAARTQAVTNSLNA